MHPKANIELRYCEDGKHEYYDDYYGTACHKCDLFYPWGGAPWDDFDEDDLSDPDSYFFIGYDGLGEEL